MLIKLISLSRERLSAVLALALVGPLSVSCGQEAEDSSGQACPEDMAAPPSPDDFLWGVVFEPENYGATALDDQIAALRELGVEYAKYWLPWDSVEPILAAYDADTDTFGAIVAGSVSDLSEALLLAHPDWIDEYAFPDAPGSAFANLVDWSATDRLVARLNAAGLSPFPLIADATTAPWVADSPAAGATRARIAPEPLGWQGSTDVAAHRSPYRGVGQATYLAHVRLHAAALARRYGDDLDGLRVRWWNTENELNWASVHVDVAGWRTGDAWSNADFLTELLRVLHEGLKSGDPDARTTMNLNVHDARWLEALKRWGPFMDAVSLGAYPNYVFAEPVLDHILSNAVAEAVATVDDAKPVYVLETGYPSGPATKGWNETLQDEYLRGSVEGTIAGGGAGYLYFKLDDAEHEFADDDVKRVENHWGLVRVDGTRKPSYSTYRDLVLAH